MQMYLTPERELEQQELDGIREKVQQRATRIPLQHIIGSVSFRGVELEVSPDALIPRPETELLVDLATRSLRQQGTQSQKILDIGTGTGCLAIALALEHTNATLWATDISQGALALARRNAVKNGTNDRIGFVLSDLFRELPTDLSFDLIVSNPPYIPTREIDRLQPEVRDHDPRLALDGGEDGLQLYRSIANEASGWLKPSGALVLEFGDDQAPKVQSILEKQNWVVEEIVQDYTRRDRFVVARLGD
jgi:release factor glutamine methyltransferase